jgi:hypothetical protein
VWLLGSIEYSAVIHPWPLPFMNGGNLSPCVAAQMTRVFPQFISADPSGYSLKSLDYLNCSELIGFAFVFAHVFFPLQIRSDE